MQTASRPLRFAAFELDAQSGELRKSGIRIRLGEQPFQVLLLLLQKAPQVVTREELRHLLWSNETFVDFDHSLNAAVKRLREALCDSADHPRFIETLPRHGYRFIYPIDACEPTNSTELDPTDHSDYRHQKRVSLRIVIVLVLLAIVILPVTTRVYKWIFSPGILPIRSIAVLPLENLSDVPAEEYFCDGVTDALISELGQIRSLRVISRHSVMQYKGTTKTIPQIAQELKVDAIIEGTVIRDGNYVRVSVQLIRAKPEEHLWARSYRRELKDILALQSEVARAIANEVNAQLTPEELTRIARAATVKPAAYDAYLQGMYRLNHWALPMSETVGLFEEAVHKDPSYAPAYVGLAESYMMMPLVASMSPKQSIAKAEAALSTAITLDSSQADSYRVLARIRTYYFDWAGAETEYQRAIALSPTSSRIHAVYGWYLTWMGRYDDSSQELRLALRTDPMTLYAIRTLGMNYLCQHRYEEALTEFLRTQELEPENAMVNADLGRLYILMHKYPQAIAQLEKSRRLAEGQSGGSASPEGYLGMAYALAGQRSQAMQVLNELTQHSDRSYVSPLSMALIYVGLNEKEIAIDWLEKGVEAQDGDLVLLKVYPLWDPLRSEPKFQNLLARLHFPEIKHPTSSTRR
jgi:TolB-like protein/DNA-binding winged helix-turn-helix (wHTH) protein/Tfp pilus assembly protein PilF